MAHVELVKLDFHGMAELDDGLIDRLFNFHLDRVLRDCAARPRNKKPRKVTIEIVLIPENVDEITGDLKTCGVEIEGKSKVPLHVSDKFHMKATANGLYFNKDFPDELDQAPLFELDEEEE